jgi:hypothetical protein
MSTGDPNRKRKGNDKRKGESDSRSKNKGKDKGKDKANNKGNQRKPSKPAPRKNTKITGERSEAGFLYKAAYLEFGIAKPWGHSLRYDFILDNGGRLHRIQVKCTEAIRAGAYETRATYTTGKGRAPYTKKDIDFIAAHVVPLDIWYIIPVEVCTPAPMLRFYPHRKAKKMRLESYREAWHLLQSAEEAEKRQSSNTKEGTIDLQAVAEETHVGTDAFVRPPSEARPVSCGAGAPARDLRGSKKARPSERSGMIREGESSAESSNLAFHANATTAPDAMLQTYHDLCTKTPPIHLAKSQAPWPIPPLRVLATRKGKHIFPDPRS